jgi:hypothetical protein
VKLFDPKCFDLAQAFLEDSPALRNVPGKADELASEIQQCIEDWLQGESDRAELKGLHDAATNYKGAR